MHDSDRHARRVLAGDTMPGHVNYETADGIVHSVACESVHDTVRAILNLGFTLNANFGETL